MKLQFTARNRELLVQYIAVMLMAVQFSFDSCVYLSSIAYWIEEVRARLRFHQDSRKTNSLVWRPEC